MYRSMNTFAAVEFIDQLRELKRFTKPIPIIHKRRIRLRRLLPMRFHIQRGHLKLFLLPENPIYPYSLLIQINKFLLCALLMNLITHQPTND